MTATLLPNTVAIKDWQQTWNQQGQVPLHYHGLYSYTAEDDIVEPDVLQGLVLEHDAPDPVVEASVHITVLPTGMGFMLTAEIIATVPLLHPRTLEVVPTPLKFEVNERFLLKDQLPKQYAEEEWLTQYGEENEAYGPTDTFDVRDWVRQWLVLESSATEVG